MKKIKSIIILIILLPTLAKAETANLKLVCPEYGERDKEISCELSAQNINNIKGLKINYILPNNIKYKDFILDNNWDIYYKDSKGLVIIKKNATANIIGTLALKINKAIEMDKNYNITISNIEASNIAHNLITHPDLTSTIKILSNDSSLSNLTLSNGILYPVFSKEKYLYTATINENTTNVLAKPTSINSTLTGNLGLTKLNYGANHLTINVTSPLKTTSTYNIIVTRPLPLEQNSGGTINNGSSSNQKKEQSNTSESSKSNLSLKDIKIENETIKFEKNKFLYKITVSNEVEKLNIKAIPTSKDVKVEIEDKKLQVGENYITITTTDADNTVCKYTIVVTKKSANIPNKDKTSIIHDSDTSESNINKNENKNLLMFLNNPIIIPNNDKIDKLTSYPPFIINGKVSTVPAIPEYIVPNE